MNNLIDDISVLTTIGKYNLEDLVYKSVSIISHDVAESIRNKEQITAIDIGIGELYISNVEDTISYKFVPARKLNTAVKDTYKTGKSQLALDVDKALGKRITNTYKDLL